MTNNPSKEAVGVLIPCSTLLSVLHVDWQNELPQDRAGYKLFKENLLSYVLYSTSCKLFDKDGNEFNVREDQWLQVIRGEYKVLSRLDKIKKYGDFSSARLVYYNEEDNESFILKEGDEKNGTQHLL